MPGRGVALLEDDPSLCELLRDALAVEGHPVVVCHSFPELHQAGIDGATLVIADTWGPGHLTLGAAERQQIVDLARRVPTVLISGRSWARQVCAEELGLAGLLPKPFDLQALIDLVGTVRPPGRDA